ncbi:MAG: hypothetical protein ACD_62C00054G0002 [uncultured bacterium]|nr:MAG: hypothetical protein ACD_62C00054G0002 [uncultured bacterium]
MENVKKITILLPETLLKTALAETGQNITATIKQGLELISASRAYRGLKKWRGQVKFSVSLDDLRKDR